eukprot:Plantae.Rhodophyta-Purpureofilum_apyrenoidigerum.ctg5146.p1 GENE.Plantae.Rhodophyta-Purpureofilum_apyrenoidigerum.ctg5146~~Plantae.Rhodophyta-Purpureofilum_apyrenoidigerum.ctg5146.p1  ORF type:complete len:669 (+),score=109.44 Plantae.Rhodophyta-Purpureofilum_apyrenoidigerum.ctg5146:505-2511(+)
MMDETLDEGAEMKIGSPMGNFYGCEDISESGFFEENPSMEMSNLFEGNEMLQTPQRNASIGNEAFIPYYDERNQFVPNQNGTQQNMNMNFQNNNRHVLANLPESTWTRMDVSEVEAYDDRVFNFEDFEKLEDPIPLQSDQPDGKDLLPEGVEFMPCRDLQAIQKAVDVLVSKAYGNRNSAIDLIREARESLADFAYKANDPDQELDADLEEVLMTTLLNRAIAAGGTPSGTQARATSSYLMNYMRSCIAESLISQRVALMVLVSAKPLQDSNPESSRLRRDIVGLIGEIMPWYDITGKNSEAIANECTHYLAAVSIMLLQAAQIESLMREVVQAFSHPRVIALARCAGRRVRKSWLLVEDAMAEVASAPVKRGPLMSIIHKLKEGLYSSFDHPDYLRLNRNRPIGEDCANTYSAAVPILGQRVVDALKVLWEESESTGGDWKALLELEQLADVYRTDSTLMEKVRSCELLVFSVACQAQNRNRQELRMTWGGLPRLLRLIRDALPQAKPQATNEFSGLVVACGVVGCAARVLGMGRDPIFNSEDGIECSISLHGFAIAYLEEVLAAEDSLEWRPLGVWLLLFASRCGNLLQTPTDNFSGSTVSDHVRAAKALRDWSLFGGTTASSAGPSSIPNFSTASLAMESAMRVIDADLSGSDEILLELCSDLVL